MRTALAAAIAAALVPACTRHLDVINPSNLAGRDVTIDTGSGRAEPATMSSDGMTVHTAHGDLRLDDVRTITDTRRARGALEGFALGFLLAAVPAAIVGYSQGDDTCDANQLCILPFTAGEKAGMFGSVFGISGGLVGAVIGAVRGSHDVYDVGGASEVQPRFTPSGPPGSVAGATIRF